VAILLYYLRSVSKNNTRKQEIAESYESIDRISEEIELVKADLKKMEEVLVSGVPMLDEFIADITKTCHDWGIDIKVRMCETPQDIDKIDLYRIFSNLVSNAVEAAQQCAEAFVTVRAKKAKGLWALSIENSKAVELKPLENEMQTTKKDAEHHGIGTRSVNKLVRKLGGTIRRFDHSDKFETIVVIPYER